MSKNNRLLLAIAAILMLAISNAFAQERTGGIEGTIKDPNGAVVPNATVSIRSAGTGGGTAVGFTRQVQSDANGFFRVLEVPPGAYDVTVAATTGFSQTTVNGVEVVLGKSSALNVILTVGDQSATVNVSGDDAAAIDPADNKIQTNITAKQAETLPKGTNFTSLLQVAPAVRSEPLGGGFQVDGASGSENTFIVDGQDVTNFRTGSLNISNNLPFQMVQEIQVKSSGFEAEFGGATGGVINVVTKGGANEFHGEFGAQFRPSQFQAGPRPFLRRYSNSYSTSNPSAYFQTAEFIDPSKDEGSDFFPTATISGPIVKNRLWFFTSFSPQFVNSIQDFNYISSDPRNRKVTATETYRAKQRREYAFLRLDGNVTDRLRLTSSFTYNPTIVEGVIPNPNTVIGTPPRADLGGRVVSGAQLQDNIGGRINSNNFSAAAVYTPNEKLVFNVRFGRSFMNEKMNFDNLYYSYGIPDVTRFLCSVGSTEGGCQTGDANIPANANYRIDYDVSVRRTLDGDASYLLTNFGGVHQFKGGFQYSGLSNDTKQGYYEKGGRELGLVLLYYGYTIADIAGVDIPAPENAIGAGYLQRLATQGKASSSNLAIYAQDRWQPFPRLSLNLGVRFERENVPSFADGLPGIKFGFGDKVAPRLGAAFDLTGDGKTKLFASYGWFYDRFKYELPRGSFGGDFFRRDYFYITDDHPRYDYYTLQRILGNNQDLPGGNCPDGGISGGTGLSLCQFDLRIPSNDPNNPITLGGKVDPDMKPFRQSEFTVGMERELGVYGLLFSGRYTHKQVDRTVEDIGIPTPDGSEAYIIGNPGYGLSQKVPVDFGFPATPKAERRYDALEVRLDKRLSKSFFFNASYTLSRLYGNYSGLASSDEQITVGNGRNSPNVNRFFDLPFLGFTANGEPDNGRLATDRPHAFKFYGSYSVDWKSLGLGSNNSTDFSAFTTVQSGTPLTTNYTFFGVTSAILNKRGDLGRTEAFTQTDLALHHKYKFGRDGRFALGFDIDVLNVFNEANELARQTNLSPINFGDAQLGVEDEVAAIRQIFNGGIRDTIVNYTKSRPDRYSSTFNLPTVFQSPRTVRFGFRLLF